MKKTPALWKEKLLIFPALWKEELLIFPTMKSRIQIKIAQNIASFPNSVARLSDLRFLNFTAQYFAKYIIF